MRLKFKKTNDQCYIYDKSMYIVIVFFTMLNRYTLSFSSILVVTGFHLSSALISEIKEVYINPEFEMLTNLNDVALVKVCLYLKPVSF